MAQRTFEPDLFEPLESRVLLAGVTIITHGQTVSPELPRWVEGMRDAIVERLGGDAVTATLRVGAMNGALEARLSEFSSSAASSQSGEFVVVLDWSEVAIGAVAPAADTDDVARAAFDELVRPGSLPLIGGSLAELPLHLIGHSRGGSVVMEMAKLAARAGLWIDHLTTLDPHPRRFIVNDLSLFANDPALGYVPNTVAFADNYFRADGFNLAQLLDFDGESVSGAANYQFVDESLFGGYDDQHSNVHLWYHGTIDRGVGVSNNDDRLISSLLRTNWYTPLEREGYDTGFAFSRAAGGSSSVERPVAGLHEALGGEAERDYYDLSSLAWPNLLGLSVDAERPESIVRGSSVSVDYLFDNRDGGSTVTLRLDLDTNPYNGNDAQFLGRFDVGLNTILWVPGGSWTWNTTATAPGTYFMYGEISDIEGRRRFLYADTPITIVAPALVGTASASQGVAPPSLDLSASMESVTLPDGRLMVGSVTGDGRGIVFWRDDGEAWSATTLDSASLSSSVTRGLLLWSNTFSERAHAVSATLTGLTLHSEIFAGVWISRDLTGEVGGEPIADQMAVFQSLDGRAHIVGMTEDGSLVLYEQVGLSSDRDWRFTNLSRFLADRGLEAPEFAGPIETMVTPWNALNIAGLDSNGRLNAVWKAGNTEWSVADLSALTGAPAMLGGLTAFTTSWDAMNFLGTDASGRVVGAWWTLHTGWQRADLTSAVSAGAPLLDTGSVTSYVTPWNALNIVGRARSGEVVVYWWTPTSEGWQVAPLSDLVPDAATPIGPLTGASTSLGMSVLGVGPGGQLLRYAWESGGAWGLENLSSVALWT